MTVNSFIEIYLTVFGWIVFDGLWGILTDTGILYVPFIGALIRNFAEPYTSQNERDASVTSIKRMEVDVFTMLTVIVLAGQPSLPISVSGTTYTPVCGSSSVSGGKTGTTYDSVFSPASLGGQSAMVPVWWMAVMRLSAGVTNAAMQSIPCGVDLRQITYEFDNEQIQDPETMRQLTLFVDDCWAPARAWFDTSHDTLPAGIDPSDINSLGSQHFLSTGYYDRYQARREIPGFPFQVTVSGNSITGRDSSYYNRNLPMPQWGHPLCTDWWSDPQHGLRKRLLAEVDPALLNKILTAMTAQGMSAQQVEDMVVRGFTANEETLVAITLEGSNLGSVSELPAYAAGAIGAKFEQATLIPKIILLKQAAPIIQALLLMLLYIMLPFILLFSSYSIATVITTSIILFAIKFLSAIWAMASWLDTRLQEAILIGKGRSDVYSRTYDYIFGPGVLDSVNKDILDLSLAGLYAVAPLVWVFGLGLAGLKVGRGIGDLVGDATKPAASAGEKGGREAIGLGKKGAGKLNKK